ncbi:MAG: hypothetical protein ACRDPC_05695 [Solirubrobacteraceae bacterium]
MHGCDHDGFHSGQGRYSAETETLRYIVICDGCGSELREVGAERYAPAFNTRGNDTHVTG